MKKLLALIMALALALTLTVPALAEEAPVPYWQEAGYSSLEACIDEIGFSRSEYYAYMATPAEQSAWTTSWLADHPDQALAFDPDAFFAAEYGDYDDKQAYMEDWSLTTQAELETQLLCTWIMVQEAADDARDQWAALQVQYPQRTELFLTQVDQIVRDEWGSDSVEDLLQNAPYFSCVEDLYLNLFSDWNDQWEREQEAQAQRSALITQLGGVPGQINVMAGRRCIAFGDRAPKMANGTLSVPADQLQRALGVIVKGDVDGYAPLRSTAEAAGWDVLWDQEYQVALLLDKTAIIAELDQNFTQLNALLVRLLELGQHAPGQSYRTQARLDASLTRFDSLDGDKSYAAAVTGELTQRDAALSGSFSLDLSSLMGMVTADQVKDLFGSGLSLSKLTSLMKSCKVEFILSPETETLYLKAPILAQFTDGQVPQLAEWISVDLTGYLDHLEAMEEVAFTSLPIGELLYYQAFNELSYGWSYQSPVDFYSLLDQSADLCTALLGNQRFSARDGSLTYRLDTQTANALWRTYLEDSNAYYPPSFPALFHSCDISLTLGQSDQLTAKADVRLQGDSFLGFGSGDHRLRLDIARASDRLKTTLDYHWQNQLSLTLTETDTMEKTNQAPLAAPPQDAVITDIEALSDLLDTYFQSRVDA